MDLGKFKSIYGDKYVNYVKEGSYRQDYINSKNIEFVIYDHTTNHYNYKLHGIDTIFYTDCSKVVDKSEIHKTDSVELILGHKCQVYKATISNLSWFYSFATELKLDPKYYEGHELGGYHELVSKAKSIYLKCECIKNTSKVSMVGDSIKMIKLDDKYFKLPNLPTKEK